MILSKLNNLNKYISQTQDLTNKKDIFLVWGLIRDILLWITDPSSQENLDLDFATSWSPDVIRENLNNNKSKEISIFRTQKYGTITIVDKKNKYEITPFRTETKYSDWRHPDEVIWSDDIILDSKRRDFTINCIYYTNYIYFNQAKKLKSEEAELDFDDKKIKEEKDKKNTKDDKASDSLNPKIIDRLTKQWYIYISSQNILILQDSQIISNIYTNWKFDEENLSKYIWQKFEQVQIIFDPHKWIQDLFANKIRAVGNPDDRFWEDALRILRAIRFAANIWWFDVEPKTRKSMKKLYFLARKLSKERIHEEIVKVFKGKNPFGYIAMLDELNLMKYIFPAVWHLKWLNQPVKYHPMDVWHHTLMVLKAWQELSDDYMVRLWCLYHDVGKTEQYYTHSFLDKDDLEFLYGSWLNHINCGADFAEEDLSKIGFSNAETETISRYVRFHMKPGEILMSKEENQIPKLRKMISDKWFEMTRNVVKICLADRRGQFNPIQTKEIDQPRELMTKIDQIEKNEWQFTIKNLAINGEVLMTELGLQPWPKLGELIKKSYKYVLDDLDRNDRQKLIKYCQKLLDS